MTAFRSTAQACDSSVPRPRSRAISRLPSQNSAEPSPTHRRRCCCVENRKRNRGWRPEKRGRLVEEKLRRTSEQRSPRMSRRMTLRFSPPFSLSLSPSLPAAAAGARTRKRCVHGARSLSRAEGAESAPLRQLRKEKKREEKRREEKRKKKRGRKTKE